MYNNKIVFANQRSWRQILEIWFQCWNCDFREASDYNLLLLYGLE